MSTGGTRSMMEKRRYPADCAAANAEKLGPTWPSEKEPMSTAISVCTTLAPVKQPGVVGL
jgi:hypothetical protein